MIQLQECTKIYNRGKSNQVIALKNISLNIDEGEFVAFVGKSGAGKSTLLHILAGINYCDSGRYILNGTDVFRLEQKKRTRFRRDNVGIIFQNFALLDDFSVYQNVSLPIRFSSRTIKEYKEKIKNVDEALKMVGISDLYKRKVGTLSGGQKQRVAIARALVNKPCVLLADEPTGALDSKTSEQIISLFKELNNAGVTILVVTHDKEISKQCSRVVEISDGEIISDTMNEDL